MTARPGSILATYPRLMLPRAILWTALVFLALHPGSPVVEAKISLDAPIVVTQVPRAVKAPPAGWNAAGLIRADWFAGARVVLVSPDGQVRVLSEGFAAACDPNISFDGQRMVFAGKKDRQSHWRIWEIGMDGPNARPISPENQDARSPIYACTLFTLNSPEPWLTLVYVARENLRTETGSTSGSSLCSVKLDGQELRRLTFNPNHNFDPFQMWDGRMIYSAERYPNQPGAQTGHVGLYAIHVEGADMECYGGERGRRIQHMACDTERGLVVFVESDQAVWDGAGQLAGVEERRPHVTYRQLTKDTAHVYLHPSPLRDNCVLVSRRSANGGDTCGVYCFDADRNQCELVFDSPDYHDVQAMVVKPRNRPDGHSTVVETKSDSGILYGLNCYDAEPRMAPHMETGMVKRVRLIEGMPQPTDPAAKSAIVASPMVPRRLVGEAPVEADGSFNLEVPSDIPLLLQTLDARGLALANCGWIWVKPKEKRGCIGCHEDPERTPENEYVLALRRPSNQLVLPSAQRRSISFRADIAPLLQQHCATAGCHGGPRNPLHLALNSDKSTEGELKKTYATLLAPAHGQANKPGTLPRAGKYLDAGRARTSWLVWQLTGGDTSRPWDQREKPAAIKSRQVRQMPPPGQGSPLSEEELRTIIQWIDMGAQYESPATPDNTKFTENK